MRTTIINVRLAFSVVFFCDIPRKEMDQTGSLPSGQQAGVWGNPRRNTKSPSLELPNAHSEQQGRDCEGPTTAAPARSATAVLFRVRCRYTRGSTECEVCPPPSLHTLGPRSFLSAIGSGSVIK